MYSTLLGTVVSIYSCNVCNGNDAGRFHLWKFHYGFFPTPLRKPQHRHVVEFSELESPSFVLQNKLLKFLAESTATHTTSNFTCWSRLPGVWFASIEAWKYRTHFNTPPVSFTHLYAPPSTLTPFPATLGTATLRSGGPGVSPIGHFWIPTLMAFLTFWHSTNAV